MAVIAYQYRGDLVDQIHRGHIAVTDHTGKILWKLGDPERLTFARSSAKPLQAIPVAESGALEHYGITPQELAVICSSHNGEPFHVKAVESILHKAGLSPDQLCCGSEYPMYVPAEDALKIAGIPRAPIYCDCSGKHAGMLITARHLGESLENYISPEHPVQQRILSVFAEMCGVETSDVQLAVDGCGVPVHALPLYRLAQGYARMSLPTLFAPTRAAVLGVTMAQDMIRAHAFRPHPGRCPPAHHVRHDSTSGNGGRDRSHLHAADGRLRRPNLLQIRRQRILCRGHQG